MPYQACFILSRCADSNRRPTPYHGVALPTELQRQILFSLYDALPAVALAKAGATTAKSITLK